MTYSQRDIRYPKPLSSPLGAVNQLSGKSRRGVLMEVD
jgi:hypothetical protein